MKNWGKARLNNLGLSLIELICTVAVFSILITGIASSVLISTRVYSKSTTDVAMQQSAQVLTNYLTNLVVDAKNVEYSVEGTSGDKVLKVTDTNDAVTTITYTDGALYIDSDNGSGLLSSNLTNFDVTNTYDENQSVYFAFSLEVANVNFDSSFTATSRNGVINESGSVLIVLTENILIMEPNQDYDVSYTTAVTGSVSNSQLVGVGGNKIYVNPEKNGVNDSYYQIYSDKIHIHVGPAETSEALSINLETQYEDPETNLPSDSKTLLVKVRRVNGINLSASSTTGTGDVGELYSITANFAAGSVFNGAKELEYEKGDYYNPYCVSWYSVALDGVEVAPNSYVEVTLESIKVDGVTYTSYDAAKDHLNASAEYRYRLKILQKINDGVKVTVTVRADHSYGASSDGAQTNRQDASYKAINGTTDVVYSSLDILIDKAEGAGSSFHRGEEYVHVFEESRLRGLEEALDLSITGYTKHWFYRVRNKTSNGTWSAWYQTIEDSAMAAKMQAAESKILFEPNSAYEFDYVMVIYDSVNKKVKYPNLYSLYEPGSPFATYSYVGNSDYQTIYQCGNRMEMPAVTLKVSNTEPVYNGSAVNFNIKADAVTAFFIDNNLLVKIYDQSDNLKVEKNCQSATKIYSNEAANEYYFSSTFLVDNFQNYPHGSYKAYFGIKEYKVLDLKTSMNVSEFIKADQNQATQIPYIEIDNVMLPSSGETVFDYATLTY